VPMQPSGLPERADDRHGNGPGGPESGGPESGGPDSGGPESGGPESGRPESPPRPPRARLQNRFPSLYLNESLVLVLIIAATLAYQLRWKEVTLGIYGLGVANGSALALQTIGIVLVYRSNRIINFAQYAIGATAAQIFTVLVYYRPLLRFAQHACPSCITHVSPTDNQVNYWISLALALGLSLLFAKVVYLVVRRFAQAPRLVLTIAMIFVAQFLPTLAQGAGNLLTTAGEHRQGLNLTRQVPLPFNLTVKIDQGGLPVLLHASDIVTVLVAVMAAIGLAAYLRLSSTGTAIRAASENPDRAGTLGINANKVTGRVWLLVGALSGVAGILQATRSGASAGLGTTTLVEILLAAVLARMSSLSFAALAALVVGVLDTATQWSLGSDVPVEGALVLLVGLVLFLQRYRTSRAELDLASGWQSSREVRPIPHELAALSVVRKARYGGAAVVAVVLLGYPWLAGTGQVDAGSTALVFGMIGLSLLVLTGWAGQISLGQFGLAAVGGYVAILTGLPFPLAIVVGGLAGAAAALLLGLPALRLRGLHLAVITLAFAVAVDAILLDPAYLGKYLPAGAADPTLAGLNLTGTGMYYFTLVVAGLITVAVVGLRHTRTGRALIAARDNERAAAALGISLTRLRLSTFAVAGFVAALAGAMFAFEQHGVNPQNFTPDMSVNVFLYAAIGGMGAVAGPWLGAVYAWTISVSSATPVWQDVATGVGGLALVLIFPGGLAKVFFDMRDAGLRRVASRHRLIIASLIADRQARAERVPIAGRLGRSGAGAFVPSRYALSGQWVTGLTASIVAPGAVGQTRVVGPAKRSDGFRGLTQDQSAEASHD
jgi:branched-chain amino acid transport system permease protein